MHRAISTCYFVQIEPPGKSESTSDLRPRGRSPDRCPICSSKSRKLLNYKGHISNFQVGKVDPVPAVSLDLGGFFSKSQRGQGPPSRPENILRLFTILSHSFARGSLACRNSRPAL